jgi:hypothetical protein
VDKDASAGRTVVEESATEKMRLTMPRQYTDYPLEAVVAKANVLIAKGCEVFQKFTCGCGSRLTMSAPNVFHHTGTCDRCSRVTNIRWTGCNMMVVSSRWPVEEA